MHMVNKLFCKQDCVTLPGWADECVTKTTSRYVTLWNNMTSRRHHWLRMMWSP